MGQRILMAAALLDDFRQDADEADDGVLSALVEVLREIAKKYDGQAISRTRDELGMAAIISIAQSMEADEIYAKLQDRIDRAGVVRRCAADLWPE